jgi:hypothetical protein
MGYVLEPSRRTSLIEDVWPSLFFGTERVAGIRAKLRRSGWARGVVARMVAECETLLSSAPDLPAGAPGWRHDYYSPVTGEHLVFDPADPESYRDPWDGSSVQGEAQRSAWILLAHERTYRLMRSFGLLYQLTGKRVYSDWVAIGMSKAVEFFSKTPRRESNHGALYFQPLYDAQIILLAANAYDLTKDSPSYQEGERERVLRDIFEKGSKSLFSYHRAATTHNMTCYVSAALASLGTALDRPDLVDLCLSQDPRGLRGLLANGLRRDASGAPDGFWFEGTTFYHFYAMFPLMFLYDLARGSPPDQKDVAGIQRDLAEMARAPAVLADQDLRLPWFGDLGSPHMPGLPAFVHLYEYCAAELDPSFSGVVSACVAAGGTRGIAALVFGPDSLPDPLTPSRSWVLPGSGVAILRRYDRDIPYYVAFRSGRHGAGHDHRDKLGVVIHAGGRVVVPDLGTAGYSVRAFREYCVSTFAHNTLMVDEENQAEVGIASLEVAGPSEAKGVVGDAYPGITMERRILLDPPRVLVADRVDCSSEHSLAWVFHAEGELTLDTSLRARPELAPIKENGPFGFLTDRQTGVVEDLLMARWAVDEGMSMRLSARWDGRFECTTGTTPSNPMTSRLGTLIIRTFGRSLAINSEFEIRGASRG